MSNASLTPQEEKQLQEAFADFDASAAIESAELVSAAGTRNLFCDNWPKVKEVLRFIAGLPMIPQAVKAAIATVISAGDLAARILCPR